MSTSSIPNLNSLRKGTRGGARGGFFGQSSQVDKDAVIRNTDGDAASSRISAVDAGYLDDPFAKHLSDENWQRRLPLMNRGTYVRTTALDRIVDTFLSSVDGPKQIISLGAGSDTRYLRLKRNRKHKNFRYHELDFEGNNKTKISRLQAPQCLETVRALCEIDLGTAETHESDLKTDEYFIHPIDLRKLPEKLDWLDSEEADRVLFYFSNLLAHVPMAIAIYEPFRPNDPFGQTMIRNLMTRGIVLQTIKKYADLHSQRQRLIDHNFTAKAADTDFIWSNWIADSEKERIDKLEWMDEVEEFVLLARHYCIAWAWRNYNDESAWQALPSPA